MQSGILAINPSDLVLPAAIAAGVLALAVFIYGFVRRFPRVSWLSWQILIVFAATFLLNVLPVPEGGRVGWNGFLLAAGLLAGTGAVVLAVGGVVRHAMLMRARPANGFFRFMSRLLGGITALGNFAVFFLVLGAPVLAALPVFHVDVAALDVVYNSPVWELFGGHAFDLFVVAVFLIMMRAGYRIGFVRTVWTVFTLALGVGALILSFVLAVRVPFLAQLAAAIAGSLPASLGAATGILGTIIVAVICFVVLLVIILFGAADAFLFVLAKNLLTALAVSFFVLPFNLAGSLCAYLAMAAMYVLLYPKVSLVSVSIAGAIVSNIARTGVAVLLMEAPSLYIQLPFICGLSVLAGIVIGILTTFLVKYLPERLTKLK